MNRPIKILRIIARLNIGGPALHVSLLTRYLGPPEFESLLVVGSVPPEEGDMSYYAESLGVRPIELAEMSREVSLVDDLKAAWALYKLIRRERPDVVHTHTAKAGTVGRLAAWFAGVPVIVHTFHGHVLRGYFGPAKTAFYLALERLCARMSTRVLAVSARVREELLAMGVTSPDKMLVCELGLDLEPFAAARRRGGVLRSELGIGEETPLVGTCGRMVPIKNQALFVAAAAQVHAQRPDVHFVIIGDGELREEMEAQIDSLGLREVVHIAGWRSDTPPLMADLDLFVLTSLNEGTPVTLIEASAAGVAAVSTRVGGVPDLVHEGETGWLVPSGDCDALAAAVLAALADPAGCEAAGQRAQAEVLERFSYHRLVRDLAELYRSLLAARRR